jgi:hypothetical protein
VLGWRFGRLRGEKIEHGLVPLFGLRCANPMPKKYFRQDIFSLDADIFSGVG